MRQHEHTTINAFCHALPQTTRSGSMLRLVPALNQKHNKQQSRVHIYMSQMPRPKKSPNLRLFRSSVPSPDSFVEVHSLVLHCCPPLNLSMMKEENASRYAEDGYCSKKAMHASPGTSILCGHKQGYIGLAQWGICMQLQCSSRLSHSV